jgi:hypothetical protein
MKKKINFQLAIFNMISNLTLWDIGGVTFKKKIICYTFYRFLNSLKRWLSESKMNKTDRLLNKKHWKIESNIDIRNFLNIVV